MEAAAGVHLALQAWQGEASRCREADGQLLGAEGDHAGHESGRVRRPCCSKRTSARVLPTTGFEELQRHDDVRVPEPSRDKALNTGKRPPNTEDEFVHLQSRALMQLRKQLQDDQLQTESLLVSRHRQLLMTDFVINESTVNCWWYNPEVHQKQPLDFFEAYGRARDERRTLIFYRDSGKGKTPLASCLAAMVARDAGLDKFVMVSSPDMLRSAVEPGRASDQQQQHRRPRRGSGHAEASPRTVARLASHHQMSLQRREGACGDVQDHHGAGPGETPPQLGRHGEDSPSGPHARRV